MPAAMPLRPSLTIAAGALASAALAAAGAALSAEPMRDTLATGASEAIDGAGGGGVVADFIGPVGAPTRHAVLRGGDDLDEGTRAAVARSVKRVGGVGGVRWEDATMLARGGEELLFSPMHCEEDVDALLRARTIRFEQASAAMDAPSRALLDEVASALRPCLGSIIAIAGHTDSSGSEPGNIELSRERAFAVRDALVARGIPRDGLRASGLGSRQPVEGLDPADPANRRIDFSVIATRPVTPTPIDTPGAR